MKNYFFFFVSSVVKKYQINIKKKIVSSQIEVDFF